MSSVKKFSISLPTDLFNYIKGRTVTLKGGVSRWILEAALAKRKKETKK